MPASGFELKSYSESVHVSGNVSRELSPRLQFKMARKKGGTRLKKDVNKQTSALNSDEEDNHKSDERFQREDNDEVRVRSRWISSRNHAVAIG